LFPKDWFFITNWTVEADWEAKWTSPSLVDSFEATIEAS
jgi:hypothetical protein